MSRKRWSLGISLISSALIYPAAHAQDSSSGDGSAAAKVNPLAGLFTPQPQFPTPQSHENPTPTVSGSNPLGSLFNVQPQYPDAQRALYPTVQTPDGANPLAGFMTGQPRFVTPETHMNPDPMPKLPGPYGTEKQPDKQNADANGTDGANKDKDVKDDKDKDKEKEEQEAKDKEKEKEKKAEKEKQEQAPQVYNPLRAAIVQLNSGAYSDALITVNSLLKEQPGDAQAHYVRAVVDVALKNYAGAITDYNAVIKLVPATQLSSMAVAGLRKLGAPLPATPKLPPLRTAH